MHQAGVTVVLGTDSGTGTMGIVPGFSIHDDDGGWIERPGLSIGFPGVASATRVIIMDGHQAYEGLTLVAEVSSTGSRRDWHGYIVDGELPPAPTIELPE